MIPPAPMSIIRDIFGRGPNIIHPPGCGCLLVAWIDGTFLARPTPANGGPPLRHPGHIVVSRAWKEPGKLCVHFILTQKKRTSP
eukprot:8066577-Pyramimonas_sp.AAC.1